MAAFRYALTRGLWQCIRNWRLLLPLYLCGLLIGLLQTWPILLTLGSGALRNPLLSDIAGGGGDSLVDLLLGDPQAAIPASLWSLAALPLTLLYSLAYNFFSGGILSVYAGKRSFWAGCRRTFWAFTGLGVLLVLLSSVVLIVVMTAGSLLGARGTLLLVLLLLQLVGVVGEYARALAVAHDRRNPFAVFGMAIGFCMRNFAGVVVLALLALLLHLALAALYLAVASVFAGALMLVVWQQLLVLVWLWIKLLRLAWAQQYVLAASDSSRTVLSPDTNVAVAG